MKTPDSMCRVRLTFADQGTFQDVIVSLPADRVDGYDRLVDLIREDPLVTRELYVDMRRLVSAAIVREE